MLHSDRGQSEKATCCMILALWHSGKGRSKGTLRRSAGVGEGLGQGDSVEL